MKLVKFDSRHTLWNFTVFKFEMDYSKQFIKPSFRYKCAVEGTEIKLEALNNNIVAWRVVYLP